MAKNESLKSSNASPDVLDVDVVSSSDSTALASILAAIVAVGATALLIFGAVNGAVSADNSSSTPLAADTGGAGHIFTGASVSILDAGTVFVSVSTDAASATDGLSIQQSSDGTNWDHSDVYTVPAGGNKNYAINPFAEYLRVVYTNGVVGQTHFRLQTIVKSNSLASSHRISDEISDEDDARLVKSILSGEDPDGHYKNVNTTHDGNLAISDNSSGLSIAQGNVTGTSFIHKFGAAPDFDTGDGFVTIWDGAEDGELYELMNYVFSATADIDSLSCENAGDTEDMEIQGLDTNYDLVTQTITATGQTRATLTTSLVRVFRVKNVGAVDLVGHCFVFVNTADTTPADGIPDDATQIRAVVHPENNQTEMAVYTIPNGYTGYLRSWYASTAGAKRDSSHTILLLARPFGQVFQLKHKANIDVSGTSYIQHEYVEPAAFAAKTDIMMEVDTDQDIAGVAGGFDIVLVEN